MWQLIRDILAIVEDDKKRHLILLQLLIIVSNIFEILGYASIIPFLSVIGNKELLYSNDKLMKLYRFFEMDSFNQFVTILGVGVFLLVCISFLLIIIKTFLVTRFANTIGFEFGDNLYKYYLSRNWSFHSRVNTSELTSKISVEAIRVKNILKSLLQINAQIFFCLFVITGLIVVDPLVTLSSAFVFLISYIGIYKSVRKRLRNNSEVLTETSELRFKTMQEGFGSIRDILLRQKINYFTGKFDQTGKQFAKTTTENQILSSVPIFFLQIIFLGCVILYILSILGTSEGQLVKVIPTLTLFVLAGVKLLPACQQIYANLAQIKSNLSAFYSIKDSLMEYKLTNSKEKQNSSKFKFVLSDIEFENVSYCYSNKKKNILNQLNVRIPLNKIIGIVGDSGSGKSTFTDLFAGLIFPKEGQIKIGDFYLNENNAYAWKNKISYISQSVFLLDGDFYENIAFGEENFDKFRVDEAIRMSNLEEVIQDLPEGLLTRIGEKGVQLSGGQRQRIGIARALYNESDILVLDEATSALDNNTETKILDNIISNFKSKTIIMVTHRVRSTKCCNKIFVFEKGNIIDSGEYQDLLLRCEKFKKLVEK